MANVKVNVTVDAMTDYERGDRIWGHETYKVQGEERRRYWVIWAEDNAAESVNVGDDITVSGLLGARVSDPNDDGNRFVQFSINSPQITARGSNPVPGRTARGGKAPARRPAQRNTRKAAEYSDDTPF